MDAQLADLIASKKRRLESDMSQIRNVRIAAESKTRKSSLVSRGDMLVDELAKTLDEFGYNRYALQKRFHNDMITSMLPNIYGTDFHANKERIKKKFNITEEIKQEVMILSARKIGKTWSVAMFVAALLITIPKINIVVFSMASRTSKQMVRIVEDFLTRHQKGTDMIIHPHSQEQITLRGTSGPDDKRVFKAYPGNSKVSDEIVPSSRLSSNINRRRKRLNKRIIKCVQTKYLSNVVFCQKSVSALSASGIVQHIQKRTMFCQCSAYIY